MTPYLRNFPPSQRPPNVTSEAEMTSRHKTSRRKKFERRLICLSSRRCQGLIKVALSEDKSSYRSRVAHIFTGFCHSWLTTDWQNAKKMSLSLRVTFLSESFGFLLHLPEWLLQRRSYPASAGPKKKGQKKRRESSYHQRNRPGCGTLMHPTVIWAERLFQKTN